ncbi:MAG TPA: DUF1501 domain-containing protein [Lacipirellulaceae bacterium]|nr:DUF1501 domain-containing protein [Lacipirellulaceae bacterium]
MNAKYACQSPEHVLARRQFLGTMAALGAGVCTGGLDVFSTPAVAAQLRSDQKRIVVFNMAGGLSQLESWDPKPGTATGGPFRSIPTSVPGIHISELLPDTAKQMQHLCLVRGVNTSEDDHGKGAYLMMTGRRQNPASEYPQIGAVAAKALAPADNPLPGYILITPGGGGGRGKDSAYLGPKYSSVQLGNGKPPQNTVLPKNLAETSEAARQDFRRHVNDQFLSRRRSAITEAFTYSFEQAEKLMQQRDVFDVTKEPEKDADRYGKYDFGRHCLLARRLLEKGISFVQVTHSNYDTHNENFNFHIEQLGEFDRPFASFVSDLAERGMLDSTLIVVLSEFGRTPGINQHLGRDHWSKAWSVCLGGGRIPRGHAFGTTNADGTAVVDGQVDHGALFHTYLEAVGVDSTGTFVVDGRKMPIADPAAAAVSELLT